MDFFARNHADLFVTYWRILRTVWTIGLTAYRCLVFLLLWGSEIFYRFNIAFKDTFDLRDLKYVHQFG